MRPIFTIHAGEYLVGAEIEKRFKKVKVWLPSKDTGIDLLITDYKNIKTVSLRVKFSKDWLVTHVKNNLHIGLESCGWWSLNRDKIKNSPADFWVFCLYGFKQKKIDCVIIEPRVLLEKLSKLHGNSRTIQSYLWVTNKNKCWETRGLNKKDHALIADHRYRNASRDFSVYLNNWNKIINKLKF